MATSLEELRVLWLAESVADDVWKHVTNWPVFARDVVGGQLARASDSIGANIAESFGRFHYGEKLNHLYYARGSLFETKYWLNRAKARDLMTTDQVQGAAMRLTELARQLNAFTSSLKAQRHDASPQMKSGKVRESTIAYTTGAVDQPSDLLFSEADLELLLTLPEANPDQTSSLKSERSDESLISNLQSPISNLRLKGG